MKKGIKFVAVLLAFTIIGSVVAAMVPIYKQVIGNLRRFDALKAVKDIWLLEQKFYEDNGFYAGSRKPNVIPGLGWKPPSNINFFDYNVKPGVTRNLKSSMIIIVEEVEDADNDGVQREKIIMDQNGILYGDY